MCCGKAPVEELSLVNKLLQEGYPMSYVEFIGPRGPQVRVGSFTGTIYTFHRGARTFVATADLPGFVQSEFKVLS